MLRSERIVTPLGTIAGHVSIREGRIDAVGPGSRDQALDLGDRWLVPGYIDTHVHGGGGAQFNTADPDEVAAVARFHAAHGTTALLATIVPAPARELAAALGAIARCVPATRPGGAAVLGAHLEGPFLNPGLAGALDPGDFLEPDERVLGRLLAAGGESVRMMTLAPELPGALELVPRLAGAGVIVSIGHSDASYAQAHAAAAAGARSATHLFNAMPPFHHREPGVLGATLDLPELNCELICDGIHVAPAAVRLAYRAKGQSGVRLITDATAAAGMPPGEYRLGAASFVVAEGAAPGAANGTIAGSTLTMDDAVRNAVRFLELPVEQVVALASANPARLLGLDARKGAIAAGFDADLTVLNDELHACATMVAGRWVRPPPI